ncbi:hypothetical protein KI655_11910 [Vibrio sp. D404a]|uniref:hypothetical protein n=1 Tax=unclassified Vibrio TaxID=2614977 RepID=UPI0025547172|nr:MULTISPECIES: hypothetical protein [unclassified Vibrio]MDK9737999.1 hypothetical protein [Vibrio sp. D404a]MDK9796290.1 hypothetical protein [Vibrio sp. D449a]
MNNEIPEIAQKKNAWLLSQLDVAYPAKESLLGRDVYKANLDNRTYQPLSVDQAPATIEEIHKVDFHKLTVLFSLNQASAYESEYDKTHILEFLSQIILSDEHQLYIGTVGSDVVASAIVTKTESELLVSDLVNQVDQDILGFAQQLITLCDSSHLSTNNVWVES